MMYSRKCVVMRPPFSARRRQTIDVEYPIVLDAGVGGSDDLGSEEVEARLAEHKEPRKSPSLTCSGGPELRHGLVEVADEVVERPRHRPELAA